MSHLRCAAVIARGAAPIPTCSPTDASPLGPAPPAPAASSAPAGPDGVLLAQTLLRACSRCRAASRAWLARSSSSSLLIGAHAGGELCCGGGGCAGERTGAGPVGSSATGGMSGLHIAALVKGVASNGEPPPATGDAWR
eukprot:2314661-Prymnesium_polylepis.1